MEMVWECYQQALENLLSIYNLITTRRYFIQFEMVRVCETAWVAE